MKFEGLKKCNDAVMKVFTWITIIFGTYMTCITFFNVILRYIFHTTIPWAEESARFVFIWVTFLGAILANNAREHMRLDFVVSLMPEKTRHAVNFVVYIALIVFLCILIHGSVRYTLNQWDWKSSALHIRHGIVYSIAPVAFTVLALQFFARAVQELLMLAGKMGEEV